MTKLALEDGRYLIKIARQAIESQLKEGRKLKLEKRPDKYLVNRGVFVTLHNISGDLRGCIGYPYPRQPLIEGIMDAAVASALHDSRFPSVRLDGLSEILIEVTVLTEPELIKVDAPREYPKHVEIGKHGLIVEYVGSSGLLLPQVPIEQDPKWDAETFLGQCCWKAGLEPSMWFDKNTKIYRFEGQIFAEKVPGGEVVEKN